MKHLIVASLILIAATFLIQSCDTTHKATRKPETEMKTTTPKEPMVMDNGLMAVMENSMRDMKALTMSGDFDLDFARMMKVHHQAAVDMSQIEIAKGSNTQMKTMAQNIITAQKSEISQLQMFVDKHKMSDTPKKMDSMDHDHDMMSKNHMVDKMKMSGNTDKDYVMMMISHHQSAIDMAEMQLKHGGNTELKKMAQMMITDQTKEIAAFKQWLANN